MDPKENKKAAEEALQNQDSESSPAPKKVEKEDIQKSSTNKSGKTGG
ncbi:hypothetical protein [Chryseobacterium sp. JK1]